MSFFGGYNYDECGMDYGSNIGGYGRGSSFNFALIVVLFILLIIVGAAYYRNR